jgi:hypothetical protein
MSIFSDACSTIEIVSQVGTWAQSCALGPSTPQKLTTPNNFKPIRPCIRHNIYSSCSPLGRRKESLICIMDSDYESDEPESDGEGSVSWDEDNYELEPLPALCMCT